MKKKIIIASLVVCYLIFIIGKYLEVNTEQPEKNTAQVRTIVTSFYPMYLHTKALTAGIDVNVVNMAGEQVGCLHDYQVTVEDMRKIQEGNIFVINGLGAENFQSKAIAQNPELKIIDASTLWLETHNHESHADLEGTVVEEEDDHDDHDHEDSHENEHLWVSVEGSVLQVQAISKGLQEADPVHAEAYRANEEKYLAQLEALRVEMQRELAALRGQEMMSVHETFAYLAEELGIEVVGTIAAGEQNALTPTQMEKLISQIKELPVPAIFTEPQYKSFTTVVTLARESGAKIYELDSFVTPSHDLKGDEPEYIERMKKNIVVLKEAYGL